MTHETCPHYNEDVGFYRAFLDPYMKYTSALFNPDDQDFETAIIRMLDKHIEYALLPEKPRILEIGSGWGSLIRRLDEKFDHFSYIGISPSSVQNAFVRENTRSVALTKTIELVTAPFEDFECDPFIDHFDAVFLSGSLCHLKDKESTLLKIRSMLRPNGRVVVEDTFFLSDELFQKHAEHPATQFLQNDVFGFAHILSWPEQTKLIKKTGFEVLRFLDHTNSYERTIDFWMKALRNSSSELAPRYIKYMDIAQKGWNYTTANYLFSLGKLP